MGLDDFLQLPSSHKFTLPGSYAHHAFMQLITFPTLFFSPKIPCCYTFICQGQCQDDVNPETIYDSNRT